MTRAQKFQWYLEKGLAEGLRALPCPSVEAARSLVTALEQRFEVLRTSIDEVDGELRQRRHDCGAPLVVIDLVTEQELKPRMAALVEAFRVGRHGRTGELLAQFFLLRTADRGWLGMVADNVAVDAGFHRVLNQEIARILVEPADGPPILGDADGIQPGAAATLEAGPRGERERTRAADQLRRHFAETPVRMHRRRPPSGVNEGRYYRRTLELPSADQLFARLVATTEMLPSALVLAAFTQLMCWRSAHDACTVNVSVDNRHNRELRLTLCATAQRIPVALTGAGQPLRAYARDVQLAMSDGYPAYGRYDPFDLLTELARAQHRRGACLTADLAFNFVPPPQGWTALVEPDESGSRPDAESEISGTTTEEVSYEYGASLSVRWADARTARLSIHGDAEALPPDECEALLGGVERMLARLAAGLDCEADEIATEVGLARRERTDREVCIAGRWIDPGLIAQRLCERADVASAEIVLGPSDDAEPCLVAHVVPAGGTPPTPADLRAGLLAAAETGDLLVIPDRYEIADSSEPSVG